MSNDQYVDGLLISKELNNNNRVHINGMMKVKEGVKAYEVDINGMMKVNLDMEVEVISNNGFMKVKGNIKSKEINCNGFLKTTDIETEHCAINGKIVCNILNCESFSLTMESNCHVKEIEAAKIEVRSKKRRKTLQCKVMTADDIVIEHVKCNHVSGDVVVIGQDCVIQKVEYKTSIQIHPTAKVMEQEKI